MYIILDAFRAWVGRASCGTIDGEPGIATNTPMCAQRQLLEPGASAEPFA